MRKFALLLVGICAAVASSDVQAQGQLLTPPGQAANNANTAKNAGYGIGYEIGMNLAASGFTAEDLLKEEIIRGLTDGWAGKEPAVKLEEVQAAMQALMKKVLDRKLASNAKFLENNKKQEGFQVTASGLQYKVLKQGTGATPTASSQVTVHYEGKLTNGKTFDSSIQRGQPATFGVSQVIRGWTEALLRMKVGDKWQLVIPSDLAYGPQGKPPIGPHEILVFEVELLEVK